MSENQKLEQEIAELDGEIAALKEEQETPPKALSWSEIDETMLEKLEAAERRRGILPRLIAAAQVKRLELERTRYERAMEPLEKQQQTAHEAVESAQAAKHKAEEDLGIARAEYSDAHIRLDGYHRRIKEINREIAELKGDQA
jgi:chromosome segregation ATPase